jgi:glycosyltransferase involved in cell wall biosynthesis
VVITRNEERDVAHALDALAFCDEIIVVDSLSTDRTAQVCASRGARVIARPFAGYGAQKRFAVAQASHDWVLCVDADEVVTPALADAICALRATGDEPPVAGYRLAFRNVFMGRTLRHGPGERHVRLFDRRRASWTDAPVHERVEVNGAVGDLPGLVLHRTARDLTEAFEKLNAYTSIAAAGRCGLSRRGPAALLASGAWHFFRHFVLRRQCLNGVPGLAWSMLFAVGSMTKYLKAAERAAEHPEPAARPVPAELLPAAAPPRRAAG